LPILLRGAATETLAMINAMYDSKDGEARMVTEVSELKQLVASGEGVVWVHLHQCDEQEYTSILKDIFNFHPLAIEDTLSTGYQPPKVDDFDDYLFVIVHAIETNGETEDLTTEELNCFLGRNYLVTASHSLHVTPVDEVWQRVLRDNRILERGADFLLHTILDAVVDEFLPFLDRIDDEVDRLEDQIILDPRPPALRRILELKHSILSLRRVASPQREVMMRLSRSEFALLSQQSQIYFRDVYDHLVRITDLSEGVRDVVSGTLDTYLTVSSNRMNEIMKTLTIVSTIFMPLTFVTGLYGMNFEFMPELHWRYGYLMVWVIAFLLIVGMLWLFRRRKWL
jgi:magnesium transporter